jgi:hypothetical protein
MGLDTQSSRASKGSISSTHFMAEPSRAKFGRLYFGKLAIIVLLFGVAGLATGAKDGQYYPSSNPARHVSLSTKMNVTHVPVLVSQGTFDNVAQILAPRPRPVPGRRIEPESLPIESAGITTSLQLRSPPAALS